MDKNSNDHDGINIGKNNNDNNKKTIEDEEYINNKKRYYIFFGLIGLFLIIITNIASLLIPQFASDMFWPKILNLWGLIFLISAIARLYIMRARPMWTRKNRIDEYDERNSLIRGKASYATYVFTICSLALLATILLYLDYNFSAILITVLIFMEFIVLLIFTKYYGDRL